MGEREAFDLGTGFGSLWPVLPKGMASKAIQIMKKVYRDVVAVIKGFGIEHHDGSELTRLQQVVQFFILTWKGFVKNRCPVRATALAYTTLLALIPLLAVVAGISTGLLKSQGQKPIEVLVEKLVANVAPQLDLVPKEGGETEARDKVVQTITESIQRINASTLGVTGVVGLIVVAILLLSTIEATFNDIWGVTVGRTWVSRLVQYWATVTLGPLIPILAMALNAGSQISAVEQKLGDYPIVNQFMVKLIPFLMLSGAFALFYQLMPNTRVRWRAALVGGLVGGALWQANSLLSFIYASKVTSYTNLYGPLSLVPVFLVGLYFSWMIVLFGAQVAYTYQNRAVFLQEMEAENINEEGREFVALRIMTLIGQYFRSGTTPPTMIELSRVLHLPTRLSGEVLESLIESRLVNQVDGMETGFTVARPLEAITSGDILLAVRKGKGRCPETSEDEARVAVSAAFDRIREAERSVASVVTLSTLVEEGGEPLGGAKGKT